jgi:hypothetical protein
MMKPIMSSYRLFIDDERFPPRDGNIWHIARDWEDVMIAFRIHGMPSFISFDHDLGEDKHTGHDIAKFLVDLDMNAEEGNTDFTLPDDFDFYVHSQNPIGKANIEGILRNYLRFKADNA